MRYFLLTCAVFALATATFAQTFAAPSPSMPGTYATNSQPRITTPSISFETPAPQVGATNATPGNIAGASVFAMSAAPATSDTPSNSVNGFNTGSSMPQDAFGLAQLAKDRPAKKPASRTFSNSDVDRLHSADPTTN